MTQNFVETPEQVQSALMHGTRQFQRQRGGGARLQEFNRPGPVDEKKLEIDAVGPRRELFALRRQQERGTKVMGRDSECALRPRGIEWAGIKGRLNPLQSPGESARPIRSRGRSASPLRSKSSSCVSVRSRLSTALIAG
jgi:hypothetical protein